MYINFLWTYAASVLLWMVHSSETDGRCKFPDFLWRVTQEDTKRLWITESKYIGNGNTWESRTEVMMEEQGMVSRTKYPAPCADYEEYDKSDCFREELLHTRTCVKEKGHLTYILKQGEKGYEKYSCIKFLRRGEGVLQVWTGAKLKDYFEETLCADDNLVRSEWPWTAQTLNEWSPCPLTGGYDFDAFLNERKRRMCHRVWRPSRLESECVTGDGTYFLFPEKSCSPFHDKSREQRLECWSFWQEEQFAFVVLAERAKVPQFIMRLPRHYDGVNVLTSKFYFSPVTPLKERGIPPANTMHMELRLSKSEGGVCYDESREVCEQIAKEGRCTNGGLHQFGNHCKKSCGLCKLAPSMSPECHFPNEYQGEWLLYEDSSRQEVRISAGFLTFSKLGSYICKGKHWEESNYKMISVYNNGCMCMFPGPGSQTKSNQIIMSLETNSANEIRAKSDRLDRSFSLCEFEDDPPPTSSRFRSEHLKAMMSTARLVTNNCGLGGLVAVNAIFPDGRSCHATLSDWNPFSCSISAKMALSFRSCKNSDSLEHQEFNCESLLTLQDHYRLLITKQELEDSSKYACWIIRLNSHEMSKEPWRQAYILRRAQCGSPDDLDPVIYKPHEVIFKIYSNSLEKDCIVMNKGATHVSTIRYTVRKGAPSKGNSRTRKQHTTTAHTQAVSQGRGGQKSSSAPGVFVLSVALTITLYQNYT